MWLFITGDYKHSTPKIMDLSDRSQNKIIIFLIMAIKICIYFHNLLIEMYRWYLQVWAPIQEISGCFFFVMTPFTGGNRCSFK
jgi:hypothetical protein